ncbi:hypothetical protein HQ529_05970 [Candidatus Woesearchaeota archaeon]|nr:hypothetical protein [Candidatus Woesearchaeota archaeon]
MKKLLYILGVLVALLLSGCQYGPILQEGQYCIPTEKAVELGLIEEEPEGIEVVPITDEILGEEDIVLEPDEEVMEEETAEEEFMDEEAPAEEAEYPTKYFMEGDLVNFPNLAATDEDGDAIVYSFTGPLDENGEWQTDVGDAGEYLVTISASDGKTEISQQVMLVVESENMAPVMEPLSDVFVSEGETVSLDVNVVDPDGDEVDLSFSGWMDSSSKETAFGDAGEYTVTITASDGVHEVSQDVMVTVAQMNRAPVLGDVEDITVTEGELVSVDYFATDLDDDELSYSFSEPLDEYGEWQTEEGDMGLYEAAVTVSDGEDSDTRSFFITVASSNMAPEITGLEDVEFTLQNEQDSYLVELVFEVSDPEGEELTIEYSGWMDEATKEATWEDAGDNIVTVTVSDGVNTVEDVILVSVNRAPQIFI